MALMDSLELNFSKGFTVLTGETGAGKSILLDAIDALFGGSSTSSHARLNPYGANTGFVEAEFSLDPIIKNWLKSNDIENDEMELIVSREWRLKDNRIVNRCRVNGVLVNKKQILSLRLILVDFTVQGHAYKFNFSSNKLNCVDRFITDKENNIISKVIIAWDEWEKSKKLLNETKLKVEKFNERIIESKRKLEELEGLNLNDPNEYNLLQSDQDRLANVVRLQENVSSALDLLKEKNDSSFSTIDQLSQAIQHLKSLSKLDSSTAEELDLSLDILNKLEDLVYRLDEYRYNLNSDPSKLNSLQERLSDLKRIQRIYSMNLEDIISLRDNLRDEMSSDKLQFSLEELVHNEQILRSKRDQLNIELTNHRKKAAQQFQKLIMEHLPPLGLQNMRFEVRLTQELATRTGCDGVDFLFSANPGQPLAPIKEVASGGEISRFILAFKTILAEIEGSGTLFFDEIDSGVSGKVSTAISRLLKDLSKTKQIFCVTHQPLIAAAADNHFRVSKVVSNGKTKTLVTPLLNKIARKQEIAELAGGDLSEAAAYADSLLDHHAA
tara:strand:+ start:7107 stop:8768 length:1662 start_codon:yes stop_codon:yes gene_type:complete